MPRIKVDGIEIEVPQGAAVLRPELERRIKEKQGQALEAAE
jgi:hypothetical protein